MRTQGIAGTYDNVANKSAKTQMNFLSKNVAKRLLSEFQTDADDTEDSLYKVFAKEAKDVKSEHEKAVFTYNFIYDTFVMDTHSAFINQDLAVFALDCVADNDMAALYDDLLEMAQ